MLLCISVMNSTKPAHQSVTELLHARNSKSDGYMIVTSHANGEY
jgi:hypothetical protein